MDVSTNGEVAPRDVILKTILLATDGSVDAHAALGAAADLAKRSGAALHLVTAYHVPPAAVYGFSTYIGPEDVSDPFEGEARTLLQAEQARVEALGVPVGGCYAERGTVFDAVINASDAVDADLIVIGNRELTGIKAMLAGSESAHVLHTAHRPVLIIRGGPECWPPAHLVVGFDRSPEAARAARIGAAIARLYEEATLTLVEAVPDTRVGAVRAPGEGNALETEHGRLDADAESMEQAAGRPVTAVVAVGDPSDALLARADGRSGSNLLIVGTRGLGAVQRVLLGSVSTRLLHSGHSPLLVVPGEPEVPA